MAAAFCIMYGRSGKVHQKRGAGGRPDDNLMVNVGQCIEHSVVFCHGAVWAQPKADLSREHLQVGMQDPKAKSLARGEGAADRDDLIREAHATLGATKE
jgi:hypothetical protein